MQDIPKCSHGSVYDTLDYERGDVLSHYALRNISMTKEQQFFDLNLDIKTSLSFLAHIDYG